MFGVFVFEGNGGELQTCVYKKYRTWNLDMESGTSYSILMFLIYCEAASIIFVIIITQRSVLIKILILSWPKCPCSNCMNLYFSRFFPPTRLIVVCWNYLKNKCSLVQYVSLCYFWVTVWIIDWAVEDCHVNMVRGSVIVWLVFRYSFHRI